MSSNTLTKEEYDKIIKDITNDSSADKTKLLYNRKFEDNTSKINVTISVQSYSNKTNYGINDKLFTNLLGRLAACKNDGKNNECESLEAKSDFFTIVKKQANRAAKGESRHKTISYKNEIRTLIDEINSHSMPPDRSRPLMLEQLFIKHFDQESYDEYITVYNTNKQKGITQTNCNMMTTSFKTRNAIYNIFLVLNEMNVADNDLKHISPDLKNKLKNTTNMDQLLKFFKIFNNSAQLYENIFCGGKRRKTKLKKRRKKRKSQKKRKLKS